MKRVLSLIATFFLIMVLLCGSVLAASTTYDLDELGIQVTIPSDYRVITRDTPADDPVFRDLGMTKSEVLADFEAQNFYLSAFSDIYYEEIVITMVDVGVDDSYVVSEKELEEYAANMADRILDSGWTVSRQEIYHHSQQNMIALQYSNADKTVHLVDYYSICNGKIMSFSMQSYEGGISSCREEIPPS